MNTIMPSREILGYALRAIEQFYARIDDQRILHVSPENRYRGIEADPPPVARILDLDRTQWSEMNTVGATEFMLAHDDDQAPTLMLPLFSPDKGTAQAVTIVKLAETVAANEALRQIIDQMSVPLQVAVEREVIYRQLDEAFAIFVVGDAVTQIGSFAERLWARIARILFEEPMAERMVTVSIGAAVRKLRETLLDLIQRANTALYAAKHNGRNQVCRAVESI